MKLTDNILAFRARHHADSEQAQPTAAIVSRLGSADPARVVGVVAAALCNIVWVYKLRGHPAAESPSAETRQGPLTSLTSPALHHFLSIRKRTPRGCVSNTVPLLTSERVATSVFCALRIRVSGDTVSETSIPRANLPSPIRSGPGANTSELHRKKGTDRAQSLIRCLQLANATEETVRHSLPHIDLGVDASGNGTLGVA